MRRVAFVLLALALGPAFAGDPGPRQEPQFRAGTHTVSVYSTVVDAAGRIVPDLTKDDFEVYDNGRRQNLSLFANDIQPITIVIMLDRSGSMASNFDLERDAAAEFVGHLLEKDKTRLGSFSNRVQIDPVDFTSDREELVRILHENLQNVGFTPLWDATSAAMTALAHQEGRRVVLVFTDGYDNPGRPETSVTFADVRERTQAEEIMVYAIGLADSCGGGTVSPTAALRAAGAERAEIVFQGRGGPGRGGPGRLPIPLIPGRGPRGPGRGPLLPPPPGDPFARGRGKSESDIKCADQNPDPGLRTLAADGGGGYFELRSTDDLGKTFARVADELHHQYLLAFTAPELDGKVHHLEVRLRQPLLTVRARRSYVATPDTRK